MEYFKQLQFDSMIKETGIGPILAATSCSFIKPLTYPDTITVYAKVIKIGTSSFVMEYVIESEKIGIAAKGEGVIVTYDYQKSEKVPIPAIIKDRINTIEATNK